MKAPTALLPLLLCLPVHAEVYKWTDENGRVHFGDDPGGRKAEVLAAPAATSPPAPAGPAAGDNRERQRRLLEVMQAEREERERAERAKAAERARKCRLLTTTLKNAEGKVLYDTSGGQQRFLTPEQTKQYIDDLRAGTRDFCQ